MDYFDYNYATSFAV